MAIPMSEGICVHAREAQANSLQRFVEESRELFAAVSSGDQPEGYGEWVAQSLSLIRMLSADKQERTEMTPAHWRSVMWKASNTWPVITENVLTQFL
jgi:hypothetical protein